MSARRNCQHNALLFGFAILQHFIQQQPSDNIETHDVDDATLWVTYNTLDPKCLLPQNVNGLHSATNGHM